MLSKIFKVLSIMLFAVLAASCGKDEPDGMSKADLLGNWYGTRYYNNNGNIKYQYFTLKLNSDKTGSMEYEAPTSYSTAYFKWKVSGDRVVCKGAFANTSGDVSDDYTLECRIENDRLIPIGTYSFFILTKDNSVMTDGEGNEVLAPDEQLYLLQNVWVASDKTSVLSFYPGGVYEEHVLTHAGSNEYSELNRGEYSFSPFNKTLTLGTSLWNALTLDSQNLVIKNGARTLSYTMESKKDIPSEYDLKQYLQSYFGWSDDNGKYYFRFGDDGSVRYMENSGRKYGSYGVINLIADGTYSVSGSTVTCRFNDVDWEYGSSGTSSWFPGWTYGQSCTKKYVIEVTPSSSIKVTFPDGKEVYMDKV